LHSEWLFSCLCVSSFLSIFFPCWCNNIRAFASYCFLTFILFPHVSYLLGSFCKNVICYWLLNPSFHTFFHVLYILLSHFLSRYLTYFHPLSLSLCLFLNLLAALSLSSFLAPYSLPLLPYYVFNLILSLSVTSQDILHGLGKLYKSLPWTRALSLPLFCF